MEIIIDKTIKTAAQMKEIEKTFRLSRLGPKYPFNKIKAGQSFLIKPGKINKISPLKNYWERKLGGKFVCQTEGENVRVWRIR